MNPMIKRVLIISVLTLLVFIYYSIPNSSSGHQGKWIKTHFTFLDSKTNQDIDIIAEHLVLNSRYTVIQNRDRLVVTIKVRNISDTPISLSTHSYCIIKDKWGLKAPIRPDKVSSDQIALEPFDESGEISFTYRIFDKEEIAGRGSLLQVLYPVILKFGYQPGTNMKFQIKLNPS